MKRFALMLTLLAFMGGAHSAEKYIGNPSAAPAQMTRLTPKQRGDLARSMVRKWAPAVQGEGGNVGEWALKVGRFIGTADAVNVQRAAAMPTYQSMMGVLQGQPATSESVRKAVSSSGQITAASLGSTIADTTYTPLPNGRCRVAFSGAISAPLPGGVTRGIDIADVVSYASQGGTGSSTGDGSTNCGIPSFVTAVAVSVTVQAAGGGAGFFKIFENGKPFTQGNTVVYDPTYNATSDVIVRACQSCALELSVYSSTPANYIIDIIGYFAPPLATALDCITVSGTAATVPANTYGYGFGVSCPLGYGSTNAGFQAAQKVVMADGYMGPTQGNFFVYNLDSNAQVVTPWVHCCRVPGR